MEKPMGWILAIVIVVALSALVWSQRMSKVEEAKYDVITSQGDIEIRAYASMIVAEAEVSGERKDAIDQGFRIIADYIFGNNIPRQKVAMTAPVVQQPEQKIAMTAPVIQEGSGGRWTVRFVMPSSYTMETLPKPSNGAVKLMQIPAKRFAVIRFSGMAGQGSLIEQTDKLNAFITHRELLPLSPPSYAFFNPPWKLPFLRRNEVMIEIAGD
jgi:hypothetical protein